ncbi:hypothetical protein [Aliterella atlantica]|uniref:CopG family transcriptional regulator n=1 Tax=Aliterella atlantica CENA595 TaxID=1618023 RepID=A0A0D8ZUK0_9CYAN|nr:hypothetical protein [Aliterella atlantica]KJH72067.1 hypothetical protein UH38_08300 [Aliterella atlantica CENA595]
MANVKTAISMPESLFQEVEALASELQVSPSGIMELTIAEFVRSYQNEQLLEKINAAYSDDAEEEVLQPYFRHRHRQVAERE